MTITLTSQIQRFSVHFHSMFPCFCLPVLSVFICNLAHLSVPPSSGGNTSVAIWSADALPSWLVCCAMKNFLQFKNRNFVSFFAVRVSLVVTLMLSSPSASLKCLRSQLSPKSSCRQEFNVYIRDGTIM